MYSFRACWSLFCGWAVASVEIRSSVEVRSSGIVAVALIFGGGGETRKTIGFEAMKNETRSLVILPFDCMGDVIENKGKVQAARLFPLSLPSASLA